MTDLQKAVERLESADSAALLDWLVENDEDVKALFAQPEQEQTWQNWVRQRRASLLVLAIQETITEKQKEATAIPRWEYGFLKRKRRTIEPPVGPPGTHWFEAWVWYRPNSRKEISSSLSETLNQLGQEGWELVGIEPRITTSEMISQYEAIDGEIEDYVTFRRARFDCKMPLSDTHSVFPVYVFKRPKQ